MSDRQVALYARVSTEQQARGNTIASQVAALRERIAADGHQIEPDHAYIDEGYSGSILLRRLWSDCAMPLLQDKSNAFTSLLLTGLPVATHIRCW